MTKRGIAEPHGGDRYPAYFNPNAWVFIGYKSLNCLLMYVDFIYLTQCVLALNKQTNK